MNPRILYINTPTLLKYKFDSPWVNPETRKKFSWSESGQWMCPINGDKRIHFFFAQNKNSHETYKFIHYRDPRMIRMQRYKHSLWWIREGCQICVTISQESSGNHFAIVFIEQFRVRWLCSEHTYSDHSWEWLPQLGTKRRGEGILRMEDSGTSEEDDIDNQDSNIPIDHGHLARNCSVKASVTLQ